MISTRIAEALDGIRTGGPDLVVSYIDTGDTMSLCMNGGAVKVRHGDHADAELWLRRASGPVLGCLTGDPTGWVAARQLEVSGFDGVWLPHPPFDVTAQKDGDTIPNATLAVQHSLAGSPVGNVRYVDHFVDGRLVDRTGGLVAQPDVVVHNTFARMIRSLDPDRPLLEAIQGAQVQGRDVSFLLIAAGLYESASLRRLLGRRGQVNEALCRLASHTTSLSWRAATAGSQRA